MVNLHNKYYEAVNKTNYSVIHGKVLDVLGELAFVKEAAKSNRMESRVRMVNLSEMVEWNIFTQEQSEKEREKNPEVFEELDKKEELHYE